ncbi:hypothetical protein KW785_02770, partial [Candidatus Parcubacteria bacterium]|nr:hypothetical protein [Candidatus Parcubacteria bacterium]
MWTTLWKEYHNLTIALIIVGLLTIILIFIAWFTPWSERQVETRSTEPLTLGTPAFLTAVESITGSPMLPLPPEGITILNNGDEFIPDLLKEIRSAQHSITITNYIFKDGELINSMLDAVIERAESGVEVRILMDGKGSLARPRKKLDELEKAGGKVETFRPVWSWRTILRGNKRTHVRATVIDGRIGYTGGAALEDGWLGDGLTKGKWRDIMFKVDGLAARSLQNLFNNLWRETSGEILSGADFYPEDITEIHASLPCKDNCYTSLLHAPTPDLEKSLSQLLWLSAEGATDHIYLETPYLLPDKNMLKALMTKAKSGVDVEIIVPGPYIDSKIVQAASRSYYNEALSAGIRIYEYEPAHIHSKIFTADGQWSLVGSANLDNRSSTLNIENVLAVESATFADDLEEQFLIDKTHTTEIKPGSFQTNFLTL